MGALSSYKVMICMGLLSACLLVSPVRAATNGTESICKDGEEQDEQEKPMCCIPNLMKENGEGKVCAVLPSDMSVAVAVTLILSFTFLISLQCFMHHHHEDMREYSYTVISSTVSIFSAVLAFQSIDGVVEDFIIDPLQRSTTQFGHVGLVIDFIHMLVWYAATQLTMAHVSCALKSDEWREDQMKIAAGHAGHEGDLDMMLHVEINSVSYGVVLAHLTGFAAINFWTTLQQLKPFNESPLLALVPIPVAVLTQLLFEKISDTLRNIRIAGDGNKDWFEDMWDKKCQEAEDDIMGLTLSVLIVNSLRFLINKSYGHTCLPNSEQKERGPRCKFERGSSQVFWLLALGFIFVVVLFLTKYIFVRISDRQDREEAIMKKGKRKRRPSCHTTINRALDRARTGSFGESVQRGGCDLDEVVERAEEVTLIVWGMAFAWCVFHGTRELLMVVNPNFLGQPRNATTLATVLAFGVSYIGFALIRILDRIAELPEEWTPHEVDDSIRSVIEAMSVFIGFSWEQTFEESVDQLAERTRFWGGQHAPAVARVVLGSACIAVVFLAWQWFILPFVFRRGWRFGYVFSRKDLEHRCVELASHDPHFSLEHLHVVAEKLAQKADEYKRRFSPMNSPLRQESPRNDDYSSLASNEIEAMRVESQEMKFFARVLEQQLEQERQNKADAMRADIRHLLETERRDEVKGLRTEIQDLKSHSKLLEQQLEESSKDIEAMRTENMELRLHTRFLEEQLKERSRSDVEAMQAEVEELKVQLADERRVVEESKVHRRYLERLLAAERQAREDLEKQRVSDQVEVSTREPTRESDEELQEDFKKRLLAEALTTAEQLSTHRGLTKSNSRTPWLLKKSATHQGFEPIRVQPAQEASGYIGTPRLSNGNSSASRITDYWESTGSSSKSAMLSPSGSDSALSPFAKDSGMIASERKERRQGLLQRLSPSGSDPTLSNRP